MNLVIGRTELEENKHRGETYTLTQEHVPPAAQQASVAQYRLSAKTVIVSLRSLVTCFCSFP